MRSLHRDMGYFVVGLPLVFALSGILLVYRDTGGVRYPAMVEKKLQSGMTAGEVQSALKLKRTTVVDHDGRTYRIVSGDEEIGLYDLLSGTAE